MATRSRRLRKKLCVEEFQELGFELAFTFSDSLSDGDYEAFFNAFLDQLAQLYLDDAKTRGASEKWRAEFSTRLNKQILPNLCHKPVDRLEYADILAAWRDAETLEGLVIT